MKGACNQGDVRCVKYVARGKGGQRCQGLSVRGHAGCSEEGGREKADKHGGATGVAPNTSQDDRTGTRGDGSTSKCPNTHGRSKRRRRSGG